ncbi:MAG: ROK family transcriptional regulator [Spartobacteria bacterium]|nr:ROK family transcriptional regulator [Spartobacteria bacterium]
MKNKVTNIEVKKYNRNQVYRYINEHEKSSKPDIASELGLSGPTIMQMVNELVEDGYVEEAGEYASTGGRKAMSYKAIQNKYHAMGVDFTQNHISMVLTDLSGKILKHERISIYFDPTPAYFSAVSEIIKAFLAHEDIDTTSHFGTGVSIPGIIDRKNEQICISHILGIKKFDYNIFTQCIGYKCQFVNDANAAAIAELHHTKNSNDMVYLSLSNSVGGAIIPKRIQTYSHHTVDELLTTGVHHRSGEFGHMTLHIDGDTCYCGKKGCIDAYCSAKVLSQYTDYRLENFFEELENNNKAFEMIWNTYLNNLSIAINNLLMAFDCQLIIGGYVGSFIGPYMPKLLQLIDERSTFSTPAETVLLPCRYRVEASALGAAIIDMEQFIDAI